MKFSTKAVAGGVAVLVAAGTLAGCSQGSANSGPTTITYLSHLAATAGPGKDLENKLVADFEKANPNVKVNVIPVDSGSESQKFQTLASAGSPPDVYLVSNDQMPQLFSKHVLAPIDYKSVGASDIAALKSKYLNGVLEGYSDSGSYYGIPSEVSNYGAWLNTKAYQDAGVAAPKTWSDVCAAGPKLLKKDSSGKVTQQAVVLPTNLPASQVFFIDALAHENGGSLFSADGKKSNLTSSAVEKAFQTVQDLVYKCQASVPSINGAAVGADRQTYGAGLGGMLFTAGSWYLGSLQKQYPNVAPPVSIATEYPASDDGKTASTAYGYAWVVPKGSKNPQLAWKFIHTLQSAGLDYFNQIGIFDGTKSVADSSDAAKVPYWTTTWKPSLEKASYAAALLNASQIYDIVGNAFTSVILKQADVHSTLQSADAQIKPLLNK
ncbi:ABC transporter substrate-binding protein [Leifsonia shinshuensis]|uniref:Multiple sugar transport system substrate-binding protein n=1 Tax=Leifsonia shinshuensis TaxID=150026 RepID=A0A853D0I1_9MICO|nr:extracellular solute-binding protein [Leifsonia shinshuensis]NYJ25929.1 multiple sugar transport system substrate-binding protein [Leifsonia shinshuensis]